jgi:hypothetical protein
MEEYMNGIFEWLTRPTRSDSDKVENNVPDEMRDAIDRVALFIARCEKAMLGDYYAATRVGRDASALVIWAFKNDRRNSRFVAFLENRTADDNSDLSADHTA